MVHYTRILSPIALLTTLKSLYYYIEQNLKIKLIVIDAVNAFAF